jgi:uncharacterized membrane protein SpoIIM required for sporulation
MKVVDLLESRREQWRRLEHLCNNIRLTGQHKTPPELMATFASLYRAACADLALADAYQLPPNTVQYLHQLVGRAHNQLYRSRAFDVHSWGRVLLQTVPQRLFRDKYLRLSFCLFWGLFIAAGLAAFYSPTVAEKLLTKEGVQRLEEMYSDALDGRDPNESAAMSGFYIFHNAGIGLQCFAAGLIYGVGGLLTILANGAMLGAAFGHMGTVDQAQNFYQFVTAHGPFELTAIVLSGAAGMRMGFSLVDTRGATRRAALRAAALESLPIVCAAVILFCLAAGIEAFVSPSKLYYWVKATVAIVSTLLLLFYFVVLGWPRGESRATG